MKSRELNRMCSSTKLTIQKAMGSQSISFANWIADRKYFQNADNGKWYYKAGMPIAKDTTSLYVIFNNQTSD